MYLRMLAKLALLLVVASFIRHDDSTNHAHLGEQYSFIYISNETSERYLRGQNISQLLRWLKTIPDEAAGLLAEEVIRDSIEFSRAVQAETSSIISSSASNSSVAIISNSTIIGGYYLAKPPAQKSFSTVHVDAAPLVSDKRLQRLPLSDPFVFRYLLRDAFSRVATVDRSIILIIKSHGDDSFAIRPRTFIDTSKASYSEIVRFFGRHAAGVDHGPVSWLVPVGIEKQDLVAILEEEANRRRVKYSLIFLESCRAGSGLLLNGQIASPYVQTWTLGQSMNYLVYSPGDQTRYKNIEYPRLLRTARQSGDLLEAFISEANRAGLRIEQNQQRQ